MNISDIIEAKNNSLLTVDEAKSYIQRLVETYIQVTKARIENMRLDVGIKLDQFEDNIDDCVDDCGCDMTTAEAAKLDNIENIILDMVEGNKIILNQ